jgi:hypothetical protein
MVTHAGDAVKHREIALGAFLDIEGAFDRKSFEVIIKAAEQHGLGHVICWWVGSMLGSGQITAKLAGEDLQGLSAGGYFIAFAVVPGCVRTRKRTR